MNWRIYISLASLPLSYPVLFASYYIRKYLREVNIKEVVKRNKEVF